MAFVFLFACAVSCDGRKYSLGAPEHRESGDTAQGGGPSEGGGDAGTSGTTGAKDTGGAGGSAAHDPRGGATSRGGRESGGEGSSSDDGGTDAGSGGNGGPLPALLRLTAASGSSNDFGWVLLGEFADETFVLSNVGEEASSVVMLALPDSSAASVVGFEWLPADSGDCQSGVTALEPGASCTLRVRFEPDRRGGFQTSLGASATAGGAAVLELSGTGHQPGEITEFPLPHTGTPGWNFGVSGIGAGPDGNVWYTIYSFGTNYVGRITPSGVVTEFPLPGRDNEIFGIVTGADANLWFVESGGRAIDRITPEGVIAQMGYRPTSSIAAGSDGNLWFTEWAENRIGRSTVTGEITDFDLPPGASSTVSRIVAGSNGNLWYVKAIGANTVLGRITTSGDVTEVDLPDGIGSDLAAGSDGGVWFMKPKRKATSFGDRPGFQLARVVASTMSLSAIDMVGFDDSTLWGIVTGPDGNFWVAKTGDAGDDAILRITPEGELTEFALPTPHTEPSHLTVGPDGNIWFAEYAANKIGRITP